MKRILLIIELLFFAAVAATIYFVQSQAPLRSGTPLATKEIIQLLAAGKQDQAEEEVAWKNKNNSTDIDNLFWKAVLLRSRFYDSGAMNLFIQVMKAQPESPIGLASACIVGVDLSKTTTNALYYFNALMILAEEHPDSIPINWMVAVMARTLTRTEFVESRPYTLPDALKRQVLLCGVQEYKRTLALMAPGTGPVLIHQTLANLFSDLEADQESLDERKLAVSMERRPWSLHAAALTYLYLGQNEEALKLVQEAIDLEEKEIQKAGAFSATIAPLKKLATALKGRFSSLEKTEKNLEKVLASLTTPPELQSYYEVKGQILWKLGRKEEALATYEKALALNPRNQRIVDDCLVSCLSLGKYEEARRCSRLALSIYPNNRHDQIWDARLAVLTGEPGASERVLKAGEFDFKGNSHPFDKISTNPWFAAVRCGDISKVRQMIPSVDVNSIDTNSDNQTALMTAAQYGWEPMVADLLKAGAKTDLVDANGDTALHYSVQFVQFRMEKLLLDAGANPNMQDKWQQTPLVMAANGNMSEDFANLILEKNPDVNMALLGWRGSAMHAAASSGKMDILKKLILRGGDVNLHQANNGDTPLMAAASWHRISMIEALLTAGADINARNQKGETVLYRSIQPGVDRPLVEMLLEKGADPTIANGENITPITKARLLGYEEIASGMEAKAGYAEPFALPALEPPNPSLSLEENNASRFIIPLRMARGFFPSFPPPKRDAVSELRKGFGINNAADLQKSITALEGASSLMLEASRLSLNTRYGWLQNMLTAAVWKIQDSCIREAKDDAAWPYSRIIYLSELGVSAGFVSKDESSRMISDASKVLAGRFSSWPEFLNSLLLGVRFHEEWDEPRYKEIRRHILEAGIPWPPAQEVSALPVVPKPTEAQTPQEGATVPVGLPTPQSSPSPGVQSNSNSMTNP